MDIVNRSPDEVKEREFETTGDTGGTDLPESASQKGENVKGAESRIGENQQDSESGNPENKNDIGSTGISEINQAMEDGADIKTVDPKDQTAGIP